jgi:hypothetical protein
MLRGSMVIVKTFSRYARGNPRANDIVYRQDMTTLNIERSLVSPAFR